MSRRHQHLISRQRLAKLGVLSGDLFLLAKRLQDVRKEVEAALRVDKARQKRDYETGKRTAHSFQVNDYVWLSAKNIAIKVPTRKLGDLYLGPFKITEKVGDLYLGPFKITEKVGDLDYRLQLPDSLSRLHPVFHIDKLYPWKGSDVNGILPPPPDPIELDGEEEWEVQEVLDSRWTERRTRKRGRKKAKVIKELQYLGCSLSRSDPCSTAPPLAASAPIARAFATAGASSLTQILQVHSQHDPRKKFYIVKACCEELRRRNKTIHGLSVPSLTLAFWSPACTSKQLPDEPFSDLAELATRSRNLFHSLAGFQCVVMLPFENFETPARVYPEHSNPSQSTTSEAQPRHCSKRSMYVRANYAKPPQSPEFKSPEFNLSLLCNPERLKCDSLTAVSLPLSLEFNISCLCDSGAKLASPFVRAFFPVPERMPDGKHVCHGFALVTGSQLVSPLLLSADDSLLTVTPQHWPTPRSRNNPEITPENVAHGVPALAIRFAHAFPELETARGITPSWYVALVISALSA
ncbi:hypothetical protein NMY22_g16907 [Coprinellus aureogranulatus]|nr:hypothetical protein NMY22_g16907 [Coprinellus aureogranulatus]